MKAIKLRITGIVQGVGFRPFIKRAAIKADVKGYVKNLGGGEVEIHIEGSEESINQFMKLLIHEKPPPVRIDSITALDTEPTGFKEFRIARSDQKRLLLSEIPQDLGMCDKCLEEVLDPSSRWYGYAFNSCAWCGPRYSMIYSLPYDREKTSMNEFPLCDECRREYEDLWNERRYHAQGISCPRCGPRLKLLDNDLREIKVNDPIRAAAELIESGKIVAIKGVGGFHIACLASSDEVVLELRRRKRRPRKPFALMALNIEIAKKLVEVSSDAEKLLLSQVKPIVILPRRTGSPASRLIAPELRTLGVMLPYTPLHYLLLSRTNDRFLVMTSGNLYGDPMISDDSKLSELSKVADYILTHNRKIVRRIDDSVIRLTYGGAVILRSGRGISPRTIKLPFKLGYGVAAFGAELQTAGAIGVEDRIILAPFSGDTDNPLVLREHESSIKFLMKSYGLQESKPIIAVDMHPSYSSRKAAEKLAARKSLELRLIQHHFAHIASAMAEWGHDPEEAALGIAIDGVGYGVDGSIWGGEIIAWNGESFLRLGHLEYHVMPGGDLATRYPLRMLSSILSKFMSYEEVRGLFEERGFLSKMRHGARELEACLKVSKEGKPLTSSTGRFLDSVSALLGLCFERTYEGEPAIILEESSFNGIPLKVDIDLVKEDGGEKIILTSKLMELIVERLDGERCMNLAYSAQYLLGKALGEAAASIAKSLEVKSLYVSGGAAVNQIILQGIADGSGLELRVNRRIPANDGGIAVGQVYIAGLCDSSKASRRPRSWES